MEDRFETFTVLIAKISRNIRKIKNREMAEQGLRSAHISCLYYIYVSEGIFAGELCEKCEEDKATVSRALDYLEQRGYISRKSGAGRYKSPIMLTDEGRTLGKKIADKISCVLDSVSREMSEAERREFYRCLRLISSGLEAAAQSGE